MPEPCPACGEPLDPAVPRCPRCSRETGVSDDLFLRGVRRNWKASLSWGGMLPGGALVLVGAGIIFLGFQSPGRAMDGFIAGGIVGLIGAAIFVISLVLSRLK